MNTIKRPEVEEVSVSCCLCGRHCKTDCKHIAIHVVPETRITAWCRKYETCLFEDFTYLKMAMLLFLRPRECRVRFHPKEHRDPCRAVN